jgi:hypothetical protein
MILEDLGRLVERILAEGVEDELVRRHSAIGNGFTTEFKSMTERSQPNGWQDLRKKPLR